jgi:hypothetical protein
MERSITGDWSLEDEGEYEKIDRAITRYMLTAAKKCGNRSRKRTPCSPELGWDVRTNIEGDRNPLELVLNFYFSKYDVDRDAHNKPLTI